MYICCREGNIAVKNNTQENLIHQACKCFDDSDYTRAKELFNKAKKYAATKYDAFIFYYLARIEENQRDYAAAYNFYSKSIDSFHSLECTLNDKYKAAIYMRCANLCLSIGYIWNAVAYYYSAYDLSENIENKLDILSDYLMSLTASNATSLEILEATQKYNKAMQSLKILPFKHVNKEEKKKKCIAYIYPDYRYHVMYSFYYNLFAKYDKNNFYIICLSLNKKRMMPIQKK